MGSFLGEKYLIRSEAGYALFESVRKLPIIDAHNHANVQEIAENNNYPNPWQLFAATDHYVWEVLRKRGVPEEYLTGDKPAKEKWLKMASVFPEVVGNPVYEWVHLDLRRYLGIKDLIGPETGERIWDKAMEVLAKPEKRPQQLLQEIGVETMCSTDDPIDTLEYHSQVNMATRSKLIRPTWRPDKAMKIFAADWREYMDKLADRFEIKLESVADLREALKQSHDYFAKYGCVASDHGVEVPLGDGVTEAKADAVFKKAMAGETLTDEETTAFMSWVFCEAAELNAQKDWVFQIHMGAVRDVRDSLFTSLGPDVGGDIADPFLEYRKPLCSFLNRFDGRLKVVLYCLDPAHQHLLATISRAFGEKVRLGSAWWLLDNPIGMKRQLEYIGSVDVLYNFAGMVSDSRKLLSYGSRFEMFRRVMCDVLGEMVEIGQAPYQNMEKVAEHICYQGPKDFFNL